MAETPRKGRMTLPLAVRSSDVRAMERCPAAWTLSYLRPPVVDVVWYIVGDTVHKAIEKECLGAYAQSDFWFEAELFIRTRIETIKERQLPHVLETANRPWESMAEDAVSLYQAWWNQVHPFSPMRMGAYDEYHWPPRVEVEFHRGGEWGTIDALFLHRETGDEAIVDWKTGTEARADKSQLNFYRYLTGGDKPAWFHHISKGKIQLADDYDEEAVLRSSKATLEMKMDDDVLAKAEEGWYCAYCPQRPWCPTDEALAYGNSPEENERKLRTLIKYAKRA